MMNGTKPALYYFVTIATIVLLGATSTTGLTFNYQALASYLSNPGNWDYASEQQVRGGSFWFGTSGQQAGSARIAIGGDTVASSDGFFDIVHYTTTGGWKTVFKLLRSAVNINADVTVSGNATANAFLYTSDRRLKDNIQPIADPSGVLLLHGVTYNWKDTNSHDIGFIAQDVEQIFPAIVHRRSDGIQTIDYVKLLPPIVELLKQQQEEINSLKKTIERLVDAQTIQ